MKKDIGVAITETLFQELYGAMLSAAAGNWSSNKSTKLNKRIVVNLKLALEKCPDNVCRQKVKAEIEKYEKKIASAGRSKLKRTVGGLIVGPVGVLGYHVFDNEKKRMQMRAMEKSIFNKALKQCDDKPHGQIGKCKEKVTAKYRAFLDKAKYIQQNVV